MFPFESRPHPGRRIALVVCLACSAWLLAACAAPPAAPASETAPEQGSAPAATAAPAAKPDLIAQSGVVQTASQPLNDLNLMKSRIPAVLTAAQQGPYAVPADSSCAALQLELLALDAALGPDIDASGPAGSDPGLMGKAVDFVGDAAMDSVRGTVNSVVDGVIPFRSWVRKLSGAERYSKAVAAAIRAGTLRRPYLKGWARASGCVEGPPAPPKPKVEAKPDEKVEVKAEP
ncbi:hypothetical protein [Rhodoferax sp. BAB1]|uniref:hypothetical protein n=1 Tax=Rhodoferax sp. BAB1 TaxID=2741720 RepID=UPI0015753237|nr:hypothetical protein [Rhodoferax sp. BAB1]QKO21932.1 hypothetical protein HTY51_08525 [Rhodoferax sp. BAB1]